MDFIHVALTWFLLALALVEVISLFVKGGFFGAYYEYVIEMTSKSTGSRFGFWAVPVIALIGFSWLAGVVLLITRIIIWRRVKTLNQIA